MEEGGGPVAGFNSGAILVDWSTERLIIRQK